MKKNKFLMSIVLCAVLSGTAFSYNTKHVIILVMDGARYTETWGDSSRGNIPNLAELAQQGCLLTNFRTTINPAAAITETCPGHARLTTGTIQNIANNGTQLPSQPSIFQQYLKQKNAPASAAWVITSKDKLFVLSNTTDPAWKDQYRPSFDCGVNHDGTGGYREDSITQRIVMQKLTTDKPALMIINYKGPDAMGHAGNWNGYLAAIREVDGYIKDLWDTIQANQDLKDSTLLFIVNDHGRHTNDYTSHGDTCEGCCHIMCLALGSDILAGVVDTVTREQTDIAPTIAELLGFEMPTAIGTVMSEILDTTSETNVRIPVVASHQFSLPDANSFSCDVLGRKTSMSNRSSGLIVSSFVRNGVRVFNRRVSIGNPNRRDQ